MVLSTSIHFKRVRVFFCLLLLCGFCQPLFSNEQDVNQKDVDPSTHFFSLLIFIDCMLGFFVGYRSGFLLQILALIAFKGYIVFVTYAREPLIGFFTSLGMEKGGLFLDFIVTLLLLLSISIALKTIHRILCLLLKFLLLQPINRLLGGFFGLLFSMVSISFCLVQLEKYNIPLEENLILSPRLIEKLSDIFSHLTGIKV